jgi:hypothetical protein
VMAERSAQTEDIGAKEAAVAALKIIASMVGKETIGVTSVEPIDDGWLIGIEVLEQARLPRTSDVLGLYEVEIARDGGVISSRRERRSLRAATGDDARRAAP